MKAVLPPEGPFQAGDHVGELEVRGLLGKGGHAFVYDCVDPFLAKRVALKVIPNPPHRGRDLLRRAREEARVLDRIDHPNVVRVTSAGKLPGGMVFIVMERLDGKSLREILGKLGRLSVPEALNIAWQVAEGVAAAHSLQVIHRDLKPENVFVESGNRVKVLDFGVAKLLGYGVETTQKELFHGTVLYMSPEHLQGYGVTYRSDIYALGTVLYEMIAGINPCLYGVEEPSMEALAWMQIARVPPPLERLVRAVPEYVALLVRRATAKQAAQRFSGMQEFADALRSALARCLRETRPNRVTMRELVEASDLPTPPAPVAAPGQRQLAPITGSLTPSAAPATDSEPSAARSGEPIATGAPLLIQPDTLPVGSQANLDRSLPPGDEGGAPHEAVAHRRRMPVYAAVAFGLAAGATVGLCGDFARRPAAASATLGASWMKVASANDLSASLVAALPARNQAAPVPPPSSEAAPSPSSERAPRPSALAEATTRGVTSAPSPGNSGAAPLLARIATPKPVSSRAPIPKLSPEAERVRRRALAFEQETSLEHP